MYDVSFHAALKAALKGTPDLLASRVQASHESHHLTLGKFAPVVVPEIKRESQKF